MPWDCSGICETFQRSSGCFPYSNIKVWFAGPRFGGLANQRCMCKLGHSNVLELSSVVQLLRMLALRRGDRRIICFIDFHVVLSCLARGRSSADSFKGLLKKVCSSAIAAGIYMNARFAPTRLNPGDHPPRDAEIPEPVPHSIAEGLSPDLLHKLSSACSLRRWISNWTRLVILLMPSLLDFVSLLWPSCQSPKWTS